MEKKKQIISKIVRDMAPSGIRVFFDLVLGMDDVISLGVGEPDFVTPWSIRESGVYSIEQGYTSYTSNKGMYKLRLHINRFLRRKYGIDYSAEDQILITVGVSEAVDLAVRSIIDPGDEVLIPQPCYVSYGPVVELASGIPIYIDTAKNGFKLKPRDVERYCTHKAKAIIINYPSNPTGVTYTKKELRDLGRVILKNNLIVISDEIYDDLTYDFTHTPIAALSEGLKNNTVYLNGFSKSFAMTGWRVGYACGSREIIGAMTKIHQYTMLCAPIMSQMAACEALHSAGPSVIDMKKEYLRRRNFVVGKLDDFGLECINPKGAFYVFPSVRSTGLSGLEFANRLLKAKKVAVVPGSAFGENFKDFIRISYAAQMDDLREAFLRIEDFVKKIK